jgi:hypothetical protein
LSPDSDPGSTSQLATYSAMSSGWRAPCAMPRHMSSMVSTGESPGRLTGSLYETLKLKRGVVIVVVLVCGW